MKTTLEVIEAINSIRDLKYCPLTENYILCTMECGGEGGKPGPCPQNKGDAGKTSDGKASGAEPSKADTGKGDAPKKGKTQKLKDLASLVVAQNKKAGKVIQGILAGGVKIKKKVKDKADSAVLRVAQIAASGVNKAKAGKDKVTGGTSETTTPADIIGGVHAALVDMVVHAAENDTYSRNASDALGVVGGGAILKGVVSALYYTAQQFAKQYDKLERGAETAIGAAGKVVGKVAQKAKKAVFPFTTESKGWFPEEEADLAGEIGDALFDMLADAFGPEAEDLFNREDVVKMLGKHLNKEAAE